MKHVCRYCQKSFMSFNGLNSHVLSAHDVFISADIFKSFTGKITAVAKIRKVGRFYAFHKRYPIKTIGLDGVE